MHYIIIITVTTTINDNYDKNNDNNKNDDEDYDYNNNYNDDNDDDDDDDDNHHHHHRIEKALIEISYNLLTAPRTASNTCVQVARAQSCANHVQHIERLSPATCRVLRDTKGQLLSLAEFESHLL